MKASAVSRIIFVLVALTLFGYVAIRANSLSFTHDEGLSYYIINGDNHWVNTANNHILNSILMWTSSFVLGDAEFSLRLPNVLGFIVYMAACFLLLKRESSIVRYCMGLSLLLFNPFLLDFFSLARGYGLSLGFALMSLYFLVQANPNDSYKKFLRTCTASAVFAFLATFANLSAINFNIAVIGILVYKFFVLKSKALSFSNKQSRSFTLRIGISIALTGLFILRLLYLSKTGKLYFGEDSLMEMLSSIISRSNYFSDYGFSNPITVAYVLLALFLIAALSVVVKRDFNSRLFQILTLIVIIVIGHIIEHAFFAARYPSGRSGLLFIPLYGLFLVDFLYHIKEYYLNKLGSNALHVLTIGTTGFLIFHAVSNASLIYTNTWKYDAHTKDAMKLVEAYSKSSTNPISISCNGMYEPSINYYIASRKLDIQPADRDGVKPTTDFVYDKDNPDLLELYEVLASFSDLGSSLYIKRLVSNDRSTGGLTMPSLRELRQIGTKEF